MPELATKLFDEFDAHIHETVDTRMSQFDAAHAQKSEIEAVNIRLAELELEKARLSALSAAVEELKNQPDPVVYDLGNNVINVMHPDYGVDATGATDTTAALESARDAAGEGGTVLVPEGAYQTVNLKLNVPGQTWRAHKRALFQSNGDGTGVVDVLRISASGITVSGGIYDGNRENWTGPGIENRCILIGPDISGIRIKRTEMRNSHFGVRATRVDDIKIVKNYVHHIVGAGLFVQNKTPGSTSTGVEIRRNKVDKTSENPLDYKPGGIAVHGHGHGGTVQDVRIEANKVFLPINISPDPANGGAVGIETWGDVREATVVSNQVSGGDIAISIANTAGGTCSLNRVKDYSGIGIEITGRLTGDIAVVGNSAVHTLDPSTWRVMPTGIALNGAHHIGLSGNTVRGGAYGIALISVQKDSPLLAIGISGGTIRDCLHKGITSAALNDGLINGISIGGGIVIDNCQQAFARTNGTIRNFNFGNWVVTNCTTETSDWISLNELDTGKIHDMMIVDADADGNPGDSTARALGTFDAPIDVEVYNNTAIGFRNGTGFDFQHCKSGCSAWKNRAPHAKVPFVYGDQVLITDGAPSHTPMA